MGYSLSPPSHFVLATGLPTIRIVYRSVLFVLHKLKLEFICRMYDNRKVVTFFY